MKPHPLDPCGVIPALAAAALAAPTHAATEYTIIDLTEIAEPYGVVMADAVSVNDAGAVIGYTATDLFKERAILWTPDDTVELLNFLPNDNSNHPFHIAEDGAIYGASAAVRVEQIGDIFFLTMEEKAVRWNGAALADLNDLVTGGDLLDLYQAHAANTLGQIIGVGAPPGHEPPPWYPNGFLLDNGIVTDLGDLHNPCAINNLAQIVGQNHAGQSRAYLWDHGVLVDLHDHPLIGGCCSKAWDVNDDERIVGEAKFAPGTPEEATVWIDREPIRLVPEYNRPQGAATSVNSNGCVVGFYNNLDDLDSPFVGFLWQDGARTDLQEVIPPEEGWFSLFPYDISDTGLIVGGGIRNGQLGRAFLMIPLPSCPADVTGDDTVDVLDLLAVLAAWGQTGERPEDINHDGAVDVLDLLAVLGAWGPCS